MKYMLSSLAIASIFCVSSASAALSSTSTVNSVKVMGSKWGNSNRGGFMFTLTSNPTGVSYFIVRPMDVGLELFLAQLLEAKALGKQVQVEYDLVNSVEGDVKAIDYK